jgi:glutathione synthase/RimK-type ligase-like ATP-grasp enzyme
MMSDSHPKILIVSTKVDIATDYVARELTNIGAAFFRLDTESFPLDVHSSFRVGASLDSIHWDWTSPLDTSHFDNIQAVWYRRHRLPKMPPNLHDAHSEYSLRESEWFLRGSVLSIGKTSDIAWMSHPAQLQMAESKLYQLTMAQKVGFTIPETLVSNDPLQVRSFFKFVEGELVVKPLRLGYFDYGDHQTSVYTNKVEWEHLQNDSAIEVAPVVYQRLLPKRFDIRVTIVSERIFTVAIDSQSIESAKIDWRRTDTANLPHAIHQLPDPLGELCLEYMSALGLTYGALDFVLTPTGEYVFLEINPNGQWVWLEDKLGLPISNSIASWLQRHVEDR